MNLATRSYQSLIELIFDCIGINISRHGLMYQSLIELIFDLALPEAEVSYHKVSISYRVDF